MDYIEFYTSIYNNIEAHTPVLFDCGELCSSNCCANNGMGMFLFPYEELYINKSNHKFKIIDSNISLSGRTIKLLYCTGTCQRNQRPLSCRIFPLFPFTGIDGRIRVLFDPRAHGTCPLLFTDIEGIYMRGLFRLKVLDVAHQLFQVPEIKDFLVHMTKELETIKKFKV